MNTEPDLSVLTPLANVIAQAVHATPVRLGDPRGTDDLVAAITLAVGAYMGRQLGPSPATLARIANALATTPFVDGDPLMEALATAIWDQCRTEGTSLVIDDPRNIAAVASAVATNWPTTPTTQATRAPDGPIAAQADTETSSTPTGPQTGAQEFRVVDRAAVLAEHRPVNVVACAGAEEPPDCACGAKWTPAHANSEAGAQRREQLAVLLSRMQRGVLLPAERGLLRAAVETELADADAAHARAGRPPC
ncbi:hypothetical protein [Streptomyces iconiensis]|uniref:DUF222 domain-containing protein n=1 Tax=Streptomyces iconiensis TaxID=1384038 RepID=A0ABT7A9E2_9ACTN|nr:hypothetical protein [Streptomyces iconiensis]MDJ1137905.1 hypothetical protein [Streptomyces iconiensis]